MLHILARSPYADPALFKRLCATVGAQDTLLLIADGVIGVSGDVSSTLVELDGRVMALADDVRARGLTEKVAATIGLVDMHGFVRLTAEHATSISWR